MICVKKAKGGLMHVKARTLVVWLANGWLFGRKP